MTNKAPVASDDTVATSEDTSATVDVLANDTDPDGDALTVTAAGTPANGATVLNPDGTITYTPAAGFTGSDSFIYLVGDGNGGFATAGVSVTVTADAIHHAPVAADDTVTTSENTPATVDVLANDTDPDGDALTVTAAGTPANGATVLNPDGTITYTPAAGFTGSDSFIYLVGDGNGGFATAGVSVTVTADAIHHAPVAADDTVTTSENTPATVDVLANDTDPDGDALTVTAAGTPANGATVLNPDGTITYTPAAGFTGSDSFIYLVGDGNGGFATAGVSVTVTADAIHHAPVAADDTVTTSENTPATVDVLANDTDPDGDALTVTAAGTPANGATVLNPDGTITYTPAAGFTGSDSFIYLVGDGNGGFATAGVSVTVTADAIHHAPVAADDTVTTSENTPATVDVLANDTDPDGDALTVTAAGTPANGATVLNPDGTITYTPAAGFTGSDSFIYLVGDGNGGFATAGVSVTVTADAIHHAPVAADDTVTTSENTPATVDVLANDTDPEGDALTVTAAGTPYNGATVLNPDGTITYTPAAGFTGSDSFIYLVGDGNGGFATAGVSVTVTADAVNHAPVASDDTVATSEDTSATVDVLANDTDPDGDALTVTAAGTPYNGATVLNPDGTITYTPAAGFTGSDSFIYLVGDGNGGFATAGVSVTVTADAIHHAPVAADDAVATSENTSATVDVLANDTDPDGDALTVTAAGTPYNGATVLNPDGTITYTPAAGFTGSDSFIYLVNDGNGGFATAGVSVTVTGDAVNHAPVAANDTVTTSENTPATVDVLANDTDPEGDALTVTAAGTPYNGATVLNPDGTITYTPAAGFTGSDSFIYLVGDGNGGFATAGVSVAVSTDATDGGTNSDDETNNAPVAMDDTFTMSQNGTLSVNGVLDNDLDADGDALIASLLYGPPHGTLALNTDGSFSYTPARGFVGTDSFVYQANDGNGGTDTATASVTVNVNAPVGLSDLVASMDPGEWRLIPGSDMNQVLLTPAEHDQIVNEAIAANPGVEFAAASFWGWTGSKAVLGAWNSAAYDPEEHRWFFMGGGHADYGGNEVYEYDFDTLQWTRLTDPSALTVKQSDGVPIPAVGPVSVHTYDGLEWNPTTDTMWLTGMAIGFQAPGSPPDPEQKAVWEFDPDTGVWTPHTVDKNLYFAAATFLPGDDVMFVADSGYSNNHGYFIDGSGNYTIANNGAQFGNYSLQSNMFRIPDSASPNLAGRVFESHKEGMVEFTLDVAAATASVTVPQAIPDLGFDKRQAGYVFNPVDELVYVWNGGREVYTWDITTGSWSTLSNAGSAIAPNGDLAGAGEIFDKWIYLDQQGVFAGIHDSRDGGIWLWKPEPGQTGSTNFTPNAIDDSTVVVEDTAKAIDVLANDTDPDGNSLRVSSLGIVSNGSAVLNANGTITYTPAADFHGTDTFTYTVSDGNGGSDTATVVVTVNPVNDAPVAANDSFTVVRDGTLNANGVLGNDQDADGDTLSAALVSGPANGSLVLNTNGSFNYTPASGFVGTDSFAYQARDGHGATDTASVNITVSASTAGTGEIATIQLQSVSGGLTAGELVSFGQAFAVGDMQAGQGLALEVNGQTIAAQMDVKATHADGSVRHAIVTTEVPAGVTGNSVDVSLVRAVSSAAAPDAQTVASTLLASGYDLTVEVTLGGQTYVADAAAALSAAMSTGLDVWMNGDLATEFRVDAAITGELHAYFDIRTHANGEVRTDVIVANDWVTSGGSTLLGADDITYDVAIKQNGQTVESHDNLEHHQQSNWHTQIWSDGSAPNARIVHDVDYLVGTGAVPMLDTSITVNDSALQKQYDALLASDTGPMGTGLWQPRVGTAGDRPDIGPVTNWTAQYLISQDARSETVMMQQADAAGGVPWHYRDPITDRTLTIEDYPHLSTNSTGVQAQYLPPSPTDSLWVPDVAHLPDMSYVPYLVTGDRYYLDEVDAQASYVLISQNVGYRNFQDGVLDPEHNQTRAVGWGLRALSNAAYISPDADPLKGYFETIVQNSLDFLITDYITNGLYDGAGEVEGYIQPYDGNGTQFGGGLAPWMDDYVTMALGLVAQRGNADAVTMLEWKSNFTAGRFTSEDLGYDPLGGTVYYLRWNDGANIFDTWREMYDATFSTDPTALHGVAAYHYAASARGALATLATETGDPRALEAYGFVVGETEDVFTSGGPDSDAVTSKYALTPRLADGSYLRHSNITVGDAGANAISTDAGSQLLHGKAGDDVLSAGDGIDLVFGGDGNDTVNGGRGDDYVFGGKGDDLISGGPGNDYLKGNQGADVFDFARLGDGKDIIADFEIGVDHIHVAGLSGPEAQSILANAVVDAHGNTVLSLGAEDTITLQGHDVIELNDEIWQ